MAEKIIGTWTNGKPIYEQTFEKENVVGGTGGGNYEENDIDISSINYETIVKIISNSKSSTGFTTTGNSYHENLALSTVTHITKDSSNKPIIRFRNNQSWMSGHVLTVTLWYTKTTD